MRLMDVALLGGSSDTLAQLLVRDKALVMSMEHIRMIITSDKVQINAVFTHSKIPQSTKIGFGG